MNLETFDFEFLSSSATPYLTVLAALMAAMTLFLVLMRLDLSALDRRHQVVVANYARRQSERGGESAVSIQLNREAIILSSLHLPYHPQGMAALRLSAGMLPMLFLLLWGYPPVLAMGGGVLAFILMGTWLQGHWRHFCNQVEQALPPFTSRLAGTLLVTTSPVTALEEVVAGLDRESPLRQWMDAFLLGLRQSSRTSFLAQAQEEATVISVSLALVVFELGRLLETGGGGFTRAFTTTAEHLTSILRARAVARSKTEAARSAVLTMLALMGVIMLVMLSAEQNRAAYHDPIIQIFSLVCLAAMAIGYAFLNSMIDDALID